MPESCLVVPKSRGPERSVRARWAAITAMFAATAALVLMLTPQSGKEGPRERQAPPQEHERAPYASAPIEPVADRVQPTRQPLAQQLAGAAEVTDFERVIELRPSWPAGVDVGVSAVLRVTSLHDGRVHRLFAQDSGSWYIDISDVPSGANIQLESSDLRIANRSWITPPLRAVYHVELERLGQLHVYVAHDIHRTDASVGLVRVEEDVYLDWGDVLMQGARQHVTALDVPCVFDGLEPGRFKVLLANENGTSADADLLIAQFVEILPGRHEVLVLERARHDQVRLAGTVRIDDIPARGATVSVNVRDFGSSDVHAEAVADSAGKFFLSLPDLGGYEAVVTFGSIEQRRVLHVTESNPIVNIVLDSGAIRGRVQNEAGPMRVRMSRTPVAGGTLEAPQWFLEEVQEDGTFMFEQLAYGRYTLSLHDEHDRLEDLEIVELSPTDPTADVVLDPHAIGVARIRIVGAGGRTLSGLAVLATPRPFGCDHWTVAGTTASDGLLDIALPTPDGALLYVQAPSDVGDGPWQTSGVVRISPESLVGRAETVVQLAASGRLEVRVVDGVTCVPSRIAVLNEDGVRLPSTGPAYEMRMVHSLHCVPAGRHTLLCNDVAGGRHTRVVEIEAGGTTVVTIDHQ